MFQNKLMCLKPTSAKGGGRGGRRKKKKKKVTQISSLFSSINPGCETMQSKTASHTNGNSAQSRNMLLIIN